MMPGMPIALVILIIVLIAVALRKTISNATPIWVVTCAGAAAELLFGQISPRGALSSIEPDVMFYLFGVFLVCQAAETSGYLEHLTDRIFSRAHTGRQALLVIVFVLGLSAALLLNDTVAIVGTPIVLQLCKSHRRLALPLLLALAFSITIGSTLSPLGNPQNLLIAVKSGMASPFTSFLQWLAIPALINLCIAYLFIYFMFRKILEEKIEKPVPKKISDHYLLMLVKASFVIMVMLIFAKILTDSLQSAWRINFSHITLIAALPILFNRRRWELIRGLDWGTLLFFASIFIIVQSVWNSHFFQNNIEHFHLAVTQIPVILVISAILSQLISNLPLTALYLPLLLHHQLPEANMLALAAGSTIAGNLTIFGAASNVIIVQNAERRKKDAFGFFEFMKYGVPLTIINILVYACFL